MFTYLLLREGREEGEGRKEGEGGTGRERVKKGETEGWGKGREGEGKDPPPLLFGQIKPCVNCLVTGLCTGFVNTRDW